MGFFKGEEEFWLEQYLGHRQTLLNFPEISGPAKANSLFFFKELEGETVIAIKVCISEPALILHFSSGFFLQMPILGKHKNVELWNEGKFVRAFKKTTEPPVLLPSYDVATEDLDVGEFLKTDSRKWERAFSYHPDYQVLHQLLSGKDFEGEYGQGANELMVDLQATKWYSVLEKNGKLWLGVDQAGRSLYRTTNILEAFRKFYQLFIQKAELENRRKESLDGIRKKIKNANKYISRYKARLADVEKSRFREIADIIMANLQGFPINSESVTLYDFYRDEDLKLKWEPGRSPQQYAARLYKKAKRQHIEMAVLNQNITNKANELETLVENLEKVSKATTLDEVESIGGGL